MRNSTGLSVSRELTPSRRLTPSRQLTTSRPLATSHDIATRRGAMMIRPFRTRRQSWRRRLLVPITLCALVLSPLTRVALHAADGDLDPAFGAGGIVTTD